jgi:hypothetical protein
VSSSSSRLECCSTPRSPRPERARHQGQGRQYLAIDARAIDHGRQRSSCARDPGRQSSSCAQVPRLQQGHVLFCLC